MTDDHVENWSGVKVYWEHDATSGLLTVGVSGPSFLLAQFGSPTEVMVAFMQAIEAADTSEVLGQMDSIRTRFTPTGFAAVWRGRAIDPSGRLPEIMNHITREIGGNEL
jgi:hypothetical protein